MISMLKYLASIGDIKEKKVGWGLTKIVTNDTVFVVDERCLEMIKEYQNESVKNKTRVGKTERS
jgi:hypothetical protein